jgi:chromosome segregation ATPase
VARRGKINNLRSKQAEHEAQINAINQDQQRIRQNMMALDRTSTLYKRYEKELGTQEDKLQAAQAEVTRLRTAAGEQERDLRVYLNKLDVL